MKNKYVSFLTDSIMSGILLCIGCAVYLSAPNALAGSFMFSLGLFAIITFKLGLYTGKAGYMAMRPASYIIEVVFTLVGNMIGTFIGGTLLNLTKLGDKIAPQAAAIIEGKVSDNPVSIFVLGVFCGILMFIAVEGNRRVGEKGDFVGSLFVMVLPVMVFIICGFNHCVADFAYFFVGRLSHAQAFLPYIVLVILGNAVGCMFIPIIKKFSVNPL